MTQGITVTINAQTANAAAELQKFFGGLHSQLTDLAAFAGVGFGAHELQSYVEKAVDAGRQMAQLNAALRSSGQASAGYTEELLAQREALAKVTEADDDALVSVQRLLIGFGISRSRMQEATELTLDLASAMGTDLSSAAMMLGRALSGEDVSFKGLRLEIDRTLPKAEQIAIAFDKLRGRYGGQARASFESGAPDLVNFRKGIDEVQKSLGRLVLADVLTPFLKKLGESIESLRLKFENFNQEHPKIANGIRQTAEVSGDLAGRIGPAVVGFAALGLGLRAVQFIMGGFSPIINGVKAALNGLAATEWGSLLTGAKNAKDLAAALSLIGEAALPTAVKVSAFAAGLVAAWQLSQLAVDRYNEEVSKGDSAAQIDKLNAAVKKHINALTEAKGLTVEEGESLKKTAADQYSKWAQGVTSADKYSDVIQEIINRLNRAQTELDELAAKTAAAAKGPLKLKPGEDPTSAYLHEQDKNPNSPLSQSERALELGKAKLEAEKTLADLELQANSTELAFKSGAITVSKYVSELRRLADARDTAQAVSDFAEKKQLNADLERWKKYKDDQINTGAPVEEIAKTQAEMNRVNLDLEKLKNAEKIRSVEIDKNELAIYDKITAARDAQREQEQAANDLALDRKMTALANVDQNPNLTNSDREREHAEALAAVSKELESQIQLYSARAEWEKFLGISSLDSTNKQLAAEQQLTQVTATETERRARLRYQETALFGQLLGQMGQAAKAFGREGFLVYKAFAVAQAHIAGAQAVLKALAETGWVGAAVAAAVAAFQIATIIAEQPPSYSKGGYTGDAARDQVSGVVHGQEFVMPADAVDRIGLPALEAMRSGMSPIAAVGPGVSGSPAPSQQPAHVQVNVVANLREAALEAMKSRQGAQIIFQHMDGRRFQFGATT